MNKNVGPIILYIIQDCFINSTPISSITFITGPITTVEPNKSICGTE